MTNSLLTQQNSTLSDARVLRAIELIWKEAALLDAKDYPGWEELFTDDAHYIVPIDPDTEDYSSSLNMIYDDKRMRRLRVERMMQGYAPSAIAAARTARAVSTFVVKSVSDEEVVIRSTQVLTSFKRNTHQMLGAELIHTIHLADDGDRIAQKVARLVNSEDAVNAAGFLI